MPTLDEIVTAARFLKALPGLLRNPIRPEEAAAILHARLAHRERDFLALVDQAVYGKADSPYRPLMEAAGCEGGDVEALVRRDGVEGALRALYAAGVYLTVDEFKGRHPAVRGGCAVTVTPASLRNPASVIQVASRPGGSRGTGSPVPLDPAAIRDWAVNESVAYSAWGGERWTHGRWSIPGGATIGQLLLYAAFGASPGRWFSQVDPYAPDLDPRYRWSARTLRWGSALARVPMPASEHVPVDAPLPIAGWMAEVLRAGGTPHLATYPSSAVRVCQAAQEAGLELAGARFSVGGEPVTPARLAAIRRAGAGATPRYGSSDAGLIGEGCLAPTVADDLHLYQDLHAVVQPGPRAERPGVPAEALLISSLRPSAPLFLLNVSLGDRGTLGTRRCGCPLELRGWTTHLHTIRSYDRLTAGGMMFPDADVVRVLEERLPARFGGAPTHYQLVEEQGPDSLPVLRLLVHPHVTIEQPEAVAEAFLAALGDHGGSGTVMEQVWRQAGMLRVERTAPVLTPSGKIRHFHSRSAPDA